MHAFKKDSVRPHLKTNVPTAHPDRSESGPGPAGPLPAWQRSLLKSFFQRINGIPVRIEYANGEVLHAGSDAPTHRVRIADPATLWRLLLVPEYYFLEGYVQQSIRIDGDLPELMRLLHGHWFKSESDRGWIAPLAQVFRQGRDLAASKRNVSHHYDVSNEFYRTWLDKQLLYTCAYFKEPQMSLEAAQTAKMDHVCRKLRLRPEETVIEAGSGWGALALHMARSYGVRVRSFNVSREQIEYARERARQEGLQNQVEFVEDDWRNIRGCCDAFVSVGMLEHVGPERYPELGSIIRRSVGNSGRGLIHSIVQNAAQPMNCWIERHIFPGAQPPSLSQMMTLFEPFGLTVLDVENLRPHYARTIRHWLARFESSCDALRTQFSERFLRMWRIYLAASIGAFEAGTLQLQQVVFAPVGSNAGPLTRAHLYQEFTSPRSEQDARSM